MRAPYQLPYWFQDFISLNYIAGAEAAEVLTSTTTYEAFVEANLTGLTFLKTRDAIGSKWRSTAPGTTAGIRKDRFYVVKDPTGNYYKLRFVSMGLAKRRRRAWETCYPIRSREEKITFAGYIFKMLLTQWSFS
ncbi:MAG: HmuY family protein [Spirosomataceae bacterium]